MPWSVALVSDQFAKLLTAIQSLAGAWSSKPIVDAITLAAKQAHDDSLHVEASFAALQTVLHNDMSELLHAVTVQTDQAAKLGQQAHEDAGRLSTQLSVVVDHLEAIHEEQIDQGLTLEAIADKLQAIRWALIVPGAPSVRCISERFEKEGSTVKHWIGMEFGLPPMSDPGVGKYEVTVTRGGLDAVVVTVDADPTATPEKPQIVAGIEGLVDTAGAITVVEIDNSKNANRSDPSDPLEFTFDDTIKPAKPGLATAKAVSERFEAEPGDPSYIPPITE